MTASTSPVAVPGTPYQLQVTVETSGDEWEFRFLFSRAWATGNHPTQRHTWELSLPGADAQVDSDLSPATIHTHSDLNKFGKVDLALQNPGQLSSHKDKCKDGTVIGSTSERSGMMTGTFDFDANDGYFDQVHRTVFHVDITKVVANGKQCPNPPFVCEESKAFVGGGQDVSVFGDRPLQKPGHSTIRFVKSEVDLPAVIYREIVVTAPLAAFTVKSTFEVKVNGNAAAPFASGIVVFSGNGSPTVSTQHQCRTTIRQEVFASGSTTAKFDSSGDQSITDGTGSASKTKHV